MKDPANSDLLWSKIHLAEGRLFAATEAFWSHPEIGTLLPDFLDPPSGFNLMWNTGVPLAALAAAPVSTSVGPVAAYNVLLDLGLALSALAAFAAARRLVETGAAALLAAGFDTVDAAGGGGAFGFGGEVVCATGGFAAARADESFSSRPG